MKRRLLLVEDDEVFLRPLHRTLELQGYEVLPVQSGEEALDTLKVGGRGPGAHGPPPAPAWTASQLVRQIKAEHPDLAVRGDDGLRHHRVGRRGHAPRRRGLSRQAVRDGGAAARHPPGHRVPGARSRPTAGRSGATRSGSPSATSSARSAGMQAIFELAPLRRRPRHDRADPRRDRRGQGAARPLDPLLRRRAASAPSWPSTARRSPPSCSSPSSSARARAPSRGPPSTGAGTSRWRSGGTLLLDEIGEMPLPLQSKLLRAIEEKKVTSVGADRPVDIDVRFIATTNKDLQAEVERGAFRRDLFYRLSVMPIRVPAAARAAGGHPAPRRALPRAGEPAARRRASGRIAPGEPSGPRPLPVAGQRAGARERHRARRHRRHRRHARRTSSASSAPTGAHAPVDLSLPFRDAKARVVEEFERAYVAGLLEAHGGKLTAAAKHADMDPKNFSDKMMRYGLRRAGQRDSGGRRAARHLKSGDRWFSYSRGATAAHRIGFQRRRSPHRPLATRGCLHGDQDRELRATPIEALLKEKRKFPPPKDFAKHANVNTRVHLQGGRQEPGQVLGALRPRARLVQALEEDARVEGALRQVVRRRQAERLLQLPRPPRRRRRAAPRPRSSGRASPGDTRTLTYWDLYREVNRFAAALKRRGGQEGRPRHHLHADGAGDGHRHAGLHAHRGAAQRDLRRLRPRRGHASASTTRSRPCSSRPTAAGGAAASCRSRRTWTRRSRSARTSRPWSCSSARARRSPCRPGRDIWWDDFVKDAPALLRPEKMDAEDMLYLLYTSGSTGKPKGIVAHHGRLPHRRLRDDQVGLRPARHRRVLVHRRHRLGHRPLLRRLRARSPTAPRR